MKERGDFSMNTFVAILFGRGILILYLRADDIADLIRFKMKGRKFVNPSKTKEIANSLLKIAKKNKEEAPGGIEFGATQKNILSLEQAVISPADDEGHILTLGGTGLGKTSALLIPTLRSWIKTKGTFLCWDISGDINANVEADNVVIYEPLNTQSLSYNIFHEADRQRSEYAKNEALIKLAFLLMPDDKNASEAGAYYNMLGREILTAALIFYYHQRVDFIDICKKINTTSYKNLLNEIDAGDNEKAIEHLNCLEGLADITLANARQTVVSAISLFATNESLQQTIGRPATGNLDETIQPTDIEQYNIFIVIDDSDLKVLMPLNKIIAAQFLDYIAKRDKKRKNPILLCMDEARSLGSIAILDRLEKYTKRHCRLFLLAQSLASLKLAWGETELDAMLTNFKYKIILESSNPKEQRLWSDLAGKEYVWMVTSEQTVNETQKTITKSQLEVDAIPPSVFGNLGEKMVLFYPGGFSLITKKPFYE